MKNKFLNLIILISAFISIFCVYDFSITFSIEPQKTQLNNNLINLEKKPNKDAMNNKDANKDVIDNKSAINNIKPEIHFIYPKDETTIQDKETIKIKTEEATQVEFYIKKAQSLTPIYLGQAVKTEEKDLWQIVLDSSSLPNGSYYLYPQIQNERGSYQEKEILINIKNYPKKDVEKENELRKKIEEKEQKIEEFKKESEEKEKQTESIILDEVKDLKQEIKEALPEEEKQEILKEIEKVHQEIKDQTAIKINELIRSNEREIKETINLENKKKEQEKIINKIEPIKKQLEEVSKIKINPKFQEVFEILEKDLEKNLAEEQNKINEIDEEIKDISQSLDKTKQIKQEIRQEIKQEVSKVAEIAVKQRPEIKEFIQEKSQSSQNKIEEGLKELEKTVSEIEKTKHETFIDILKDSDDDGISDQEELKIKTDPFNADSDSDGYLDGIEREAGFNPLDSSLADKIVYEYPEKTKAPISENYKISRIEMIDIGKDKKGLKIEGKGLPNTFVTIYIYSQPLVLITKVDSNGNFTYILDKPIEEGAHRIYVAITDNKGTIQERSNVFNFLKTPTMIAAIIPSEIPEQVISPTQNLYKIYSFFVISFIVLGLIASLIIIDLLIRKKRKIS